jgi:NADH-quinone oxidoreductase subunit K
VLNTCLFLLNSPLDHSAFELKIAETLIQLHFSHDLLPLAVCIFLVGLVGFIESRDFLTLLVATELMMLGINFYLITLSVLSGSYAGQIYALCFLAITAAETAIGLGLLILLYRSKGQITFAELSSNSG